MAACMQVSMVANELNRALTAAQQGGHFDSVSTFVVEEILAKVATPSLPSRVRRALTRVVRVSGAFVQAVSRNLPGGPVEAPSYAITFAFARVVALVEKQHPQFREVFVTGCHLRCPALVPYAPLRSDPPEMVRSTPQPCPKLVAFVHVRVAVRGPAEVVARH